MTTTLVFSICQMFVRFHLTIKCQISSDAYYVVKLGTTLGVELTDGIWWISEIYLTTAVSEDFLYYNLNLQILMSHHLGSLKLLLKLPTKKMTSNDYWWCHDCIVWLLVWKKTGYISLCCAYFELRTAHKFWLENWICIYFTNEKRLQAKTVSSFQFGKSIRKRFRSLITMQ